MNRLRVMQRTYETRLPAAPERDALLDAYAALYGRAERTLFARLRAGERVAPLKSTFLIRFGLTVRQFNALAATVQGKIASVRNRRPQLIATLARRIARAHAVLATVRTVSLGITPPPTSLGGGECSSPSGPPADWATTSPFPYPCGIGGSMCGRSGARSRGGKRRSERTDGRVPPGSDPRRHRLRDLDGTRPGL